MRANLLRGLCEMTKLKLHLRGMLMDALHTIPGLLNSGHLSQGSDTARFQ